MPLGYVEYIYHIYLKKVNINTCFSDAYLYRLESYMHILLYLY